MYLLVNQSGQKTVDENLCKRFFQFLFSLLFCGRKRTFCCRKISFRQQVFAIQYISMPFNFIPLHLSHTVHEHRYHKI
jgi:hypothetical protein